jgi:large subunit ribosomal protein L9
MGLGEIDKRKVEISGAIRSIGKYEASVRLTSELVANLTLQVVAAK